MRVGRRRWKIVRARPDIVPLKGAVKQENRGVSLCCHDAFFPDIMGVIVGRRPFSSSTPTPEFLIMKVIHYSEVTATPVQMEGAVGCQIRCLIGQDDGAPSFSMRHFEVAPGGHTPLHTHGYEHEVFILEGSGELTADGKKFPLQPGMTIYVDPNAMHQFRNVGATTLKFLCLIPLPLRGLGGNCVAACGCG